MSESEFIGVLDTADGAWEDSGFYLCLATDEGDGTLRINNIEAARSLLNAVKGLESWVEEADYHKSAYDRATPEERAKVLGGQFDYRGPDSNDAMSGESWGYEPDDPKSPGFHDRYAAFYDDRDKGEVGP